jgi:hypothetical protein
VQQSANGKYCRAKVDVGKANRAKIRTKKQRPVKQMLTSKHAKPNGKIDTQLFFCKFFQQKGNLLDRSFAPILPPLFSKKRATNTLF